MSGRRDGQWHTMTWRDADRRVRDVACGLLSLGFKKEERGAILATSRPDWVIADLGILSAGGATSTIYTSNTAEESAYILEDSGSRVCFVENAMQEAKLREVRGRIGDVAHLDPHRRRAGRRTAGRSLSPSWSAGARPGTPRTPAPLDARRPPSAPEDLATLIYTSGTTGSPRA